MQSINNWITRVNSNNRLVHRGRWVNLTFIFGIDDQDFLIKINNGVIISIKKRTVLTESGEFRIHGKSEVWEKHWLNMPPKDYHDIFAMLAKRIIIIDGNLIPLMQNLQYFKDIIISNGTSDF